MQCNFTGIYERVGNWYIGYVEELPGANAQERTLEKTRESLKEAVALILRCNRKLAKRQLAGKKIVREPLSVNFR